MARSKKSPTTLQRTWSLQDCERSIAHGFTGGLSDAPDGYYIDEARPGLRWST
jgi:hypothetical protein